MTIPIRATYRLQLSASFTLDDARALVPYLSALGISHLYASPVLRSRPGSSHGYDVVDPTRLDPELGSEASWEALVSQLRAYDMGIVLDIVPNHMGVGADNPFWDDLFANGQASRYASWFDIDWDAPARGLKGRVLIPILGHKLADVIAQNELAVVLQDGRFRIAYFDHSFPLDPTTILSLLDDTLASLPRDASAEDRAELAAIRESLASLPQRLTNRRAEIERRQKEAPELLRRLEALAARAPTMQTALAHAAEKFAEGDAGRARLTALLERQVYALAFWRRAAHEINYRRFFDINELVALRMEDPAVFGATHRRIIQWVKDGQLDGLRIDHVDGLRNPREYLDRLHATIQQVLPGAEIPLFVEKILSGRERLRAEWPVAGTTGYEFLGQLDAIFIDPDGMREIERSYRNFLDIRRPELDFHEVAVRGKALILRGSLAPDVQRLAALLAPIARRDPRTQSLTRVQLGEGIVQLIARLPVYRTYIEAGAVALHEDDRAVLEIAFGAARSLALIRPPLLELLGHTFLADPSLSSDEMRAERNAFVLRFQQVSGPATAKGIEDTALYRYSPLLSRNEVGADPGGELRDAVGYLHDANIERSVRWPRTMLATSTHDTKRSADVRSRLDVLSEIPEEWSRQVAAWARVHRGLKERVGDRLAPDPHMEYVLYQTLVGFWPTFGSFDEDGLIPLRERVTAFALKAAREAKGRTSWIDPNEEYERALTEFIALILDRRKFVAKLESLVRSIARSAAWNALARTLLHLTSPGFPDIYQGDEYWNFSLVDPDNREPVVYRADRLTAPETLSPTGDIAGPVSPNLFTSFSFDTLKLMVIRNALRARANHEALFSSGSYAPLVAHGPLGANLFAFARRSALDTLDTLDVLDDAAIIVVPRLTHALSPHAPPVGELWSGTDLHLPIDFAHTRWRCAISGRQIDFPAAHGNTVHVPVDGVLEVAPLALLIRTRVP
ncbi:MAG: malto-oligosyltrehalose synthase [Gemmatimonadaceae bacterium]